MRPNHAFTGRGLVALALCGMATFSLQGLAADEDQAEREARRYENEIRRQQEQANREIEDRARIQAEALRGQQEAIRRLEDAQARMRTTSEQLTQQAAEQARTYPYSYYPYAAPATSATPDRATQDPIGRISFAPLSERLKTYFGTQSGVLVVNAGGGAPFGLQDGDVIIAIDGRVPVDGGHATSILRSYRPGERVKLRVQRDRRVIDLEVAAPRQ